MRERERGRERERRAKISECYREIDREIEIMTEATCERIRKIKKDSESERETKRVERKIT